MSDQTYDQNRMTSERWRQISDLFGEALEQPVSIRAEFLARKCGSDTALREEVEALLAANDDSTDGFLDRPAVDLWAPAAREGDRIGRYHVRHLIGRGGMGEVYVADDTKLARIVALKLVRPSTGEPSRAVRLLREARAASVLSHPNVCVVHDVGETERGLSYIAMEYVEGDSLRERLARNRAANTTPGLTEVIDWGVQAAEGLAAAHAVGVLHRDIKPENLLVRPDGLLKVVDFGVAARLPQTDAADSSGAADTDSITAPGAIIGTVPYMSPEQLRAEPLDVRSDVWSLGAVLYELLTGVPAFTGKTQSDTIVAVLEREPYPIAEASPKVPPLLSALVMRMLSKAVEGRPADMYAVLQELGEVRASLVDVRRVRPRSPTLQRASVLAGGGALLVAALVAAGVFRPQPHDTAMRSGAPTPVDPARVLVTPFLNRSGDSTLDGFGGLAADWIALGLQTVPTVRVVDPSTAMLTARTVGRNTPIGLALATRAGHVASGHFDVDGDSVVFVVRVTDATSGEQQAMLRVSGRRSDRPALLGQLRQRVGGALARRADNRTAALADAATQPPALDAYRAYGEGLAYFAKRQYGRALPHFLEAIRLDSTFMLPRFWAMFAYGNMGASRREERYALLEATARYRALLSPLDLASLQYFEAERRGDRMQQVEALRRASALAPGSNWTYMLALRERELGRSRRALELLESLDPREGWVRGWAGYWAARADARHDVGEFVRQLDDTRQARRIDPDDSSLRGLEIVALAANGHVTELRAKLDSLRVVPRTDEAAGDAVAAVALEAGVELRAHGYVRDGYALLDEVADWPVRADMVNGERERIMLWRAKGLLERGRLSEAEDILRHRLRSKPDDLLAAGTLAIVLASEGNRPAALEMLARADTIAAGDPRHTNSRLFVRGVVLGILGEQKEGTALIRTALARGYHGRHLLHRYAPLIAAMRGYGPFEELLQPLP